MKPYSNRLINESSPYLLQHAHNPVDWFPWSDEALNKAKEENKPILVSIGYAACHWCHVMEKESFEDPTSAHLMNTYFVCIKVDREERPDLDHFFMDALQAIAGQGGWPLNMFLTSDAKPFYGGTYFPPEPMHNRISWKELLVRIHEAYHQRRDEIEEQARDILTHLSKSNQVNEKMKERFEAVTQSSIDAQACATITQQLLQAADLVDGGFGRAPKFPQSFSLLYLIRYHHFHGDQAALDHAILSLDKMMQGGIYDQVGGGFCRYSTDDEWLAPHFEKMTYDNALLVLTYTEAWQLTGKPAYKRVVEDTIGFMTREMREGSGGFYAALDADSEGIEGKYYTWSKDEFDHIIRDQRIADLFDISAGGNWEGVNIPRMLRSLEAWAGASGIPFDEAMSLMNQAKQQLLQEREKRVRPLTDDKVLLGWNALFNAALTRAGLAFERTDWIEMAKDNMGFLLRTFYSANDRWLHTHKAGEAKFPAFLDDLAFLLQSLLYCYEADPDLHYLEEAKALLGYIIDHFSDDEGVYFLFSPSFDHAVPVRKLDLYDGALPSGNAVMAWNLYRMALLFDRPDWRNRALTMLEGTREAVLKWPNSFGVWAGLILEISQGTLELAVMGDDALNQGRRLLRHYLPNRVFMAAMAANDAYPLLKNREKPVGTTYHICRNYACELPFFSESAALEAILTKR